MSSTKPEVNQNLMRKVATLKKHALDVKFDLDDTDYKPLENIGIGAFGVVCSAIHKKTQDRVAIKKIPAVFEVDAIAKRTYREIKILKHFKHDNVISIRELLCPKNGKMSLHDIYVVFDLMESDLHKIIYSSQELSDEHVRYFLYQLLRGLKYIHSANVIHRDLKPSNLLVNEDCQLRIGDFGMSRGISSSPDEPNFFMTQYVATRWYRAPEIMLSLVMYTTALDMWSVGCIFAEMLGRKHLFPGKDYISQMKLIIGVLGSPSESLINLCQSDMVKNFFQRLGHKEAIPWTTLFPKASRKAIKLLSRMLLLHPEERIKVEDALAHPYLNKYHDPDDEPICLPPFNFDFEKTEMNKDQLRDVIYDEIIEYHTPRTPTFSFNAFIRPVPKPDDSQQGKECEDEGETTETLQEVPDCDETKLLVFDAKLEENKSLPGGAMSSLDLPSNDVVMLSAKVEEKTEEEKIQSNHELEQTESESQHQDNKTISMNTKMLIKAALMNASLKKLTDSSSENKDGGKLKPITAAQRQREREEKRMKKKWKSVEKMKKLKGKKGKQDGEEASVLSSADKQMLERWTSMAAKNPVTIATQEGVQAEETIFGVPLKVAGRQPLQEIPFPVPSLTNSTIVQHGLPLTTGHSQQHTSHVTSHVTSTHMTSCHKPSEVMTDTNQNHFSQQHNSNPSTSLNYSTIDLEGLKLCGLMNLNGNLFQTNTLSLNPSPQNLSGAGLMPNDNQLRRNSDEHSSPHSSGSCPASPEQNILSLPDSTYTYGSGAVSLQKRASGELSPPRLPALSTSPCAESGISLENQFQITPQQNFVCLPEVSLSEARTVTRDSLTDSGYSLGSHVDQNIPSIQLPFSYNPDQPSTSERSHLPQQDSPPDNISQLTKQLSRSQVEDGGPPALVHTPRGTCSGYGVGMDFEQLMFDAQESELSGRVEPSPLSSSLLSDWMEVTGNINLDLVALEQELQSPMALSYSDFNLYSS
ncbi:hypothetical protein ScPMuIL_007086 [Solemya velum]